MGSVNWFGLIGLAGFYASLYFIGHIHEVRNRCAQYPMCRQGRPCPDHHPDGTLRRKDTWGRYID